MNPFFAGTRLAVAGAGLFAAAPHSAPSRPVVTSLWDIQSSGQWSAPKDLAKGDPLLELPIPPQGMIELGEAVVRMIAPTLDYPFMVEPGTVKL